ncbi:MAG: VOC family protein [Actinobacteria bacterium]|nr:VOC family protein [Actinomycetota bacterium]
MSHVILFVADLDASVAFYRDVIGLDVRFTEHGYAELDTEGTRLALFERSRVPSLIRRSPGAPGPTSEVVLEVADAAGEAERLRALGVKATGPVDRPWGHRTVHVLDPDGHVVELAERIPRTRPRGAT